MPGKLLNALEATTEGEPDPARYMPVAAVQSMLAGRMEERLALSEERAEEKASRAFKEGFLAVAMKPWALAPCRSDEAAFDDDLAKSGPGSETVFAHLMKPSHTTATPRAAASEAAASDLERAICEQLGLKPGSLIE
ncbi:MAG: phage protease [Paracoccaceae bacterium]